MDADEALLKAIVHPLRNSLLKRFVEAGHMLSPKELASQLNQPLANVSYHVRQLARHGAVELVAEEGVHGSVAHFYEPTELARRSPWLRAALGIGRR